MNYFEVTSIFFFVLGLVFGSFGNVLIYRIPAGMRIDGRSKCPHCTNVLQPTDLVPVLSYLFLRGKCRNCKCSISPRYVLIEVLSAVMFLLAFVHTRIIATACILAIALWLLLLITAIDYYTQGIPDVLSFPFIGVSFIYGLLSYQLDPLAFAVCSGFFALQWIVSRGRWVGSGDVLLSVGLSSLLGRWELAVVMLCVSYIFGSVIAIYLLAKKKSTAQDRLAFAPFLSLGTVIALFAGDWILRVILYL